MHWLHWGTLAGEPVSWRREMTENTWLTCSANPSIIFTTPCQQRLTAAASSLGVDLHLLSGQVGHA